MAGRSDPDVRRDTGRIVGVPMATAIVRTFTKDGFAIAADGLVTDATRGVIRDSDQKIFRFGTRYLAFSFAGCIQLTPPDSEVVKFDFTHGFREAVRNTPTAPHRNMYEYALALAGKVATALDDAHRAHQLVYPIKPSEEGELESGLSVATVFVDGYFNATPRHIRIRFRHENNELQAPHTTEQDLSPQPRVHGSPIISNLCLTDERFEKFKVRGSHHSNRLLNKALSEARCYIRSCESPEGRALDAEYCTAIGGKIRMATITKNDGFQWTPGFDGDDN